MQLSSGPKITTQEICYNKRLRILIPGRGTPNFK